MKLKNLKGKKTKQNIISYVWNQKYGEIKSKMDEWKRAKDTPRWM